MIRRFLHKIKTNLELQKIVENFSWLFFDKVLQYAVRLVVGIWLARYLGPEKYGIYSYALAFTAIFGVIAGLGLKGIVVRELVQAPDRENNVLGSAFALMLVAGIFTWCLSSLAMYTLRPNDQLTFFLVTIISAGFVFQAIESITYYFESRLASKFVVFAKNLASLLSSALKIFLIISKQGLIAFAFASLFDLVLIGIGLVIVFRVQKLTLTNWKWDWSTAKSLLKDSYPLILSGIMVAIYMKIDQIMLREMVNEEEVGLYSVAVRLTELWYFIPVIIQSSLFPNITRSVNDQVLDSKMYRLFSLMFLFTLSIAIPTTLFGKWIIEVLFGAEYIKASSMLTLSIWALLFVSFGVARNTYLLTKNFVKQSFYFTALGAVANIGLNLLLLPKFGGNGAAIATLISYGLSAYLSNFLYRPLFGIGKMMTKAMLYPKIQM